MSKDKPNFENSIKELEKIVDDLENNDLELEKALTLYEKGVELSSQCSKKLSDAKKRIDILIKEGIKLKREKFEE